MGVRIFTGLRPSTAAFERWELLYVRAHMSVDDESIGDTIGRTAGAVAEMKKVVKAKEAETKRKGKRKAVRRR